MKKRKILIGSYDTALTGLWTLREWTLGDPALVEKYEEVPGHSGLLDLSTALTDGEPCYGNRSLTITLESSEGSRLEREDRISQMVNWLDGRKYDIILPDDPTHYITGRVRVTKLYNDHAHASVKVTANCEPWRYNAYETVIGLTATSTEQSETLINNGRLSVVPIIQVTGGLVNFTFESRSWVLGEGTHIRHGIYLRGGAHSLRYSGTGTILLTYREAVL